MPDAATATLTDTATPATGVLPADTGATTDLEAGAGLVEDELIVEEISIDGMCGVY